MHRLIHKQRADSALSQFNEKWNNKYKIFTNYLRPPWWAPGLILTDEIRYNYQNYLPVEEYLSDLKTVFLKSFSNPILIPRSISNHTYKSIPDFWCTLPNEFKGNIIWKSNQLLNLACAIASPAKFGSKPNRYPEQHHYILEWLMQTENPFMTGVEYGCSTGYGTYELALLLKQSEKKGMVLGVTVEPLEIWMALNKYLPYRDHCQNHSYPSNDLYDENSTFFVVGDFRNFNLKRKTDFLVINGLVGGPAFNSPKEMTNLWLKLQSELKSKGLLVVGNYFHDGYRSFHDTFCEIGQCYSNLECKISNSLFFKMK